jgi:DNA-binding transcriptional MerR regulator
MSDISERVAIRYWETRGVILPGHGDTIAAYRAAE